MPSVRAKTTKGIFWNFAEQVLSKGVSVLTTIVLAWFLVPEDYALVAMLAVFMALSTAIVNGGLSQALIRKASLSPQELDTVFLANIALSVVVYAALYVSAPLVAGFYEESRLVDLIRVVAVSAFFQAGYLVHKTILVRELNFKKQLQIMVPATGVSSVAAVLLAYYGLGVWALIFQIVINNAIIALLYWTLCPWRPSTRFSIEAFRELWSFSRYLVVESMLAVPFRNMYLIVLPKFFAAGPVGLYFFAEKVKEVLIYLSVQSIMTVTFPALSMYQEDPQKLKAGYRQVIAATSFLLFPLIFILAALAPLMFEVALPDKWHGASLFLQLMCVASVMYPLHSINLNILQVKGRSDLVLYVGLVKKAVTICIFALTVRYGIEAVLLGQIMASLINYAPNAYYSAKLVDYRISEQFRDFMPSLALAALTSAAVYSGQSLVELPAVVELVIFAAVAMALYVLGAHIFRLRAYFVAKDAIKVKMTNKKMTNKNQ